ISLEWPDSSRSIVQIKPTVFFLKFVKKRRHHAECDGLAKHHSKNCVPGVFPKNGRSAGRSVCITKETNLKGIKVSDLQIDNICMPTKGYMFCLTDSSPNLTPLEIKHAHNLKNEIYQNFPTTENE
ncbi:unnamed protein product, partial [Acanthoscelides obtectus]